MSRRDVIIVGGGPAGLSAARALRHAGVDDVLVIEREEQAGGLPLDCTHAGFGLGQYRRLYTGPGYVRRLLHEARGIAVMTRASVVELHPGGGVSVATAEGLRRMDARAVLLATGIRETPRPPRLVSGGRPFGLLTTGALQRFLRETGTVPFRRPVIVGSEWVSFSALHTLRHAGLRAVAMIEERPRPTIPAGLAALARAWFACPLFTATRLARVHGLTRVEGVDIVRGGKQQRLDCDAVLFTGGFVPEAALARHAHLDVDAGAGGPVVDQHWRCSDPAFFAAGNVLRPVESSGRCGLEGEAAGRAMAAALAGTLPAPRPRLRVHAAPPIRYACPGALCLAGGPAGPIALGAQVTRPVRGELHIVRNGLHVHRRRIDALPDRRLVIPLPAGLARDLQSLELRIEEPRPAAHSST